MSVQSQYIFKPYMVVQNALSVHEKGYYSDVIHALQVGKHLN